MPYFTKGWDSRMWNRSRDTDRERNAREREARIRGEDPPDERPAGYWVFVAVVGIVALAVAVFFVFS